jgi:DNA-binding response OmpR family regulator
MDIKKLLIVEDEFKIADTLKLGLTENGYNTDVAYDGLLGLRKFQEKEYDLIILDINLPGINGYDLCKKIRALNSNVPIIFLTSLIGLNDKLNGYNIGADDYIVNPFEFKELVYKIKVFLNRSRINLEQNNKILTAGDLEMNLESKIVTRGGKSINLTAKEFQLLEYLLRHKNKVVPRSDIALNVWDIDFESNTNIIDVYINYLRNKVDKPFKQKLIQTLVGMGYILKDNEN